MEGGLEKILYAQRSIYKSSLIQSTLLELEESMKAMLTLIHQDDGKTFAHKAEIFYQKKPELVKRVEDFQKLCCLVVEHCRQISSPLSLSPTSAQKICHGVERAIKFELESSDSSPKSGVEDPELETNTKSAIQLKSPMETANGFGPDATDEMSSEPYERDVLVENQLTAVAEKDVQKRNGSTFTFSANTFEDSDVFHYSEQQISYSEQILELIEKNCTHLSKLTRRIEEKREASKDLRSRIEMLTKENQILEEQHSKLMDENGDLHMKLQKLMSLRRSTAKKKHHTSQFSLLKTLLLSAIHEGGLP